MKVLYGEGLAHRTGPEPCAVDREVGGEASAGGGIGQPLSRERLLSRTPTTSLCRKAMRAVAIAIGRSGPAWSETLACAQAPRAGTGRSLAHLGRKRRRIASGRRGAVAGDERAGEVRLRHSSREANERSRATGRGAGGAKGGDRRECGPAKRVPDTASGLIASQALDRRRPVGQRLAAYHPR